mgnify:CR=1 FL=1
MKLIADDLDTLYRMVVSHVYRAPDFKSSPRGMATHEVLSASVTLTNPRARLIESAVRSVNYRFAAAEFMWYWLGRDDVSFIERYNRRLREFSDDGKTLNSAYGRRMFGPGGHGDHAGSFGSQWRWTKHLLEEDPDSRRAIIHILGPDDVAKTTKDVPCTCTLQFFIRSGALHMHTHMRSNDVFWGMPYDIFSFTLMQEAMAIELGVKLGHYHHTVGSLHIYERHFDDAKRIIAEDYLLRSPVMPPLTSNDVMEGYFGHCRLHSLWNVCNAEAYVSTKQEIPEAMRPLVGSGEEWLIDRLYEKWGPASQEAE